MREMVNLLVIEVFMYVLGELLFTEWESLVS